MAGEGLFWWQFVEFIKELCLRVSTCMQTSSVKTNRHICIKCQHCWWKRTKLKPHDKDCAFEFSSNLLKPSLKCDLKCIFPVLYHWMHLSLYICNYSVITAENKKEQKTGHSHTWQGKILLKVYLWLQPPKQIADRRQKHPRKLHLHALSKPSTIGQLGLLTLTILPIGQCNNIDIDCSTFPQS